MEKAGRVLFCLLFLASVGHPLDPVIRDAAYAYKGYDELISNITEVGCDNATCYWVDYTKTLMYSGSLLLDEKGEPVTDDALLESFVVAGIIKNNYPPESAEQWSDFGGYFDSFSRNLADPVLSGDAEEIATLFEISSRHMGSCIKSLSPDNARAYLENEDLLIEAMKKARENAANYSGSDSRSLTEYRDSLANIGEIIEGNRESLLWGSGQMTQLIKTRVEAENKRPSTDLHLIGIGVLVILFLFLLKKIKR
ncbi:MAG: hypothetical protein JW724_03075 [Candidatus Altiarchaeota archaeon]|nr:hypothetical protein [Candidatus Altiarchaeota archaeon]